MKKTLNYLALLVIVFGMSLQSFAQEEELSPYLKVGDLPVDMNGSTEKVKSALESAGFTVLGDYAPEGSADLHIVAYTRKDLQDICLTKKERGALASVLKIGFVNKEGLITVSMLNPMYIFYAYLGDDIDDHVKALEKIAGDAKTAMSSVGDEFTPFGGSEEPDDLKDYHFMAFMPRFDDPVELNEYGSFDEGLQVIRKNLAAKTGNTVKVYELVFPEKKIAVFGIGLLDKEKGEAHFLPIIGEENIAAMPYEIILQNKEATMLHGKYRFAILWPELSMGEFMKIMSTPGDVEDTMEAVAGKE
jgi:hypothetical protein